VARVGLGVWELRNRDRTGEPRSGEKLLVALAPELDERLRSVGIVVAFVWRVDLTAAAGIVLGIEGFFGLDELRFGGGADLEHVDLEADGLAGERVVGVDDQRVAPDLEHTHDEVAIGPGGHELFAELELFGAVQAGLVELEAAFRLVVAEGIGRSGLHDHVRPRCDTLEAPLDRGQNLTVAVHVLDGDGAFLVVERERLTRALVVEGVAQADVVIGGDDGC
jgi:hypothetical protein